MKPSSKLTEWTCTCGAKKMLYPSQVKLKKFCGHACPEYGKFRRSDVYRAIRRMRAAGKTMHGRAAMGSTHYRAKPFALRSPSGEIHTGVGLMGWIREHPELFDPLDAAMKKRYRREGESLELGIDCRAVTGLARLVSGERKQWKGWTRAPSVDTKFNDA